MFLKLVKQDFRATARLMLPVYAAAIVLAVFVRVYDAVGDRLPNSGFVNLFGGLVTFLFSLAMIATVFMSFILMIWRFHKNYMTDEGYLMFTLPVTTAQLIFSKLLVAVGWFFCSGLVSTVASAIAAWRGGSIEVIGFDELPMEQLRQVAASSIVTVLISGVAFCLMLYACMAIGQSFRRHKGLMSVGFFFVFYVVMQIVGVSMIAGMLHGAPDSMVMMTDTAQMLAFTNKMMWRFAAFSAVFGVIYYAITHYMLAKKLNLQ